MLYLVFMKIQGWPIVGWTTVVVGGLCAVLLGVYGLGDDGYHAVIRHTAQASFVLFLAAYYASSLRVFWRSDLSKWLLANRRYLGVSYAVSHTYHLGFIVLLATTSRAFRDDVSLVTIIGGGMAYVLMYLMVLTSFDRTAAALGRRNWVRLHKVGIHYNWAIFFNSYISRALAPSLFYAPFALALIVGLALRIAAWQRARRATQSFPATSKTS